MDRNESVAPNGAAAAARARAKERITDAWELKGKATTATCGGGDDAAGAIVFRSARLGVASAARAMRCDAAGDRGRVRTGEREGCWI